MVSPYYNRNPLTKDTRATAEQLNAEFAKIAAAFDQLPAPSAISDTGGQPNYTWYAYADSADGTSNFSTSEAGQRAYVGIAVNRTTATRSQFPEDYQWARIAGPAAPGVILQYRIDDSHDWHEGFQTGDTETRQSVDGGFMWHGPAHISVADLAELDPDAAEKLDGIEDGADQTTSNTPHVTALDPIVIEADPQGNILAGQLPATCSPRRYRGNVDVSPSTNWTLTLNGASGTVNNTPTDVQRGVITITAIAAKNASMVVLSQRDGVDIEQIVPIARHDAPVPAQGGGGGSGAPGNPASTNAFAAIGTSSTHIALTDWLKVKVGSSGNVDLAAQLSFSSGDQGEVDPDDVVNTFMALKWRYSPDGSSSIADVHAETEGDQPAYSFFRQPPLRFGIRTVYGYTDCATTKTGLSSGADAYFQLMGRMVAGGVSIAGETGQASATPE